MTLTTPLPSAVDRTGSAVSQPSGSRAPTIPLLRILPTLLRSPLRAFEQLSVRAEGRIVRPDLGVVWPFLVTHPDHVQYVLRERAGTFVRDGMMWNSIRRLLGNGIITDGATWEPRRAMVQPLFAGKNVGALLDELADAVNEVTDELSAAVSRRPKQVFDLGAVMSKIADRAFSRTLFGNRMTTAESAKFTSAVERAFSSVAARILLPFIPDRVPMPGDRAFRRAIRDVDDVMLPLVRSARTNPGTGIDVLSALLTAQDGAGRSLTDREVRDDAVSMFAAGFETSAVALSWFWVVLAEHPDVAQRLHQEVEEVVGTERPGAQHLPGLRYTKMVMQEVLRQYSPGWIIPRVARADEVIDGIRIPAGSTVLISPYLTHRLPQVWPDPDVFDPERFTPERIQERHRFAYLPFGGGPHGCIGSHFFTTEAQLVVASMLSRFRPERSDRATFTPAIGASLRPKQRIRMRLRPHLGAVTAPAA